MMHLETSIPEDLDRLVADLPDSLLTRVIKDMRDSTSWLEAFARAYAALTGFTHDEALVAMQVDDESAENIGRLAIIEMTKYLIAIGTNPGSGISPSRVVDCAWHAFMLDSVPYARWCDQHFSRYLHHSPFDPREPEQFQTSSSVIEVFGNVGVEMNPVLWDFDEAVKCPETCGDTCGGLKPARQQAEPFTRGMLVDA